MRYRALAVSMLSVLAACAAPPPATGDAARRPNLVLIIADDMNWNDCGAYGHPTIRTPHLDRLAREGMRFTRAYLTASSCSPSRASIITGRYPHNTDAEQLHWPLPEDQITFVQKLKAAGYWCASAGKWHLGPHVESHFDRVSKADVSGFQLPSSKQGQKPAMVAQDASGCADWIPTLRARPKDKPFFLWLAALDPHRDYQQGAIPRPHTPEEVRVPPHLPDTPEVRADLALYYDEITRLDGYVGQVVAELESQGVADDTMILFISDNGRPFPRDKTTLYDGGIRTPWIVKFPGRVKPGTVNPNLVSSIDIAPTLLELAGLDAGPTFEGISFTPMLADTGRVIRQYAFAEDHWHDFEDHARAVCSTRYKYIRNDYPDLPNTPPADAGRSPTFGAMRRGHAAGTLTDLQRSVFIKPRAAEELYDLQEDPRERHNLADDPARTAVLGRHRQALAQFTRRTGDYIPSRRTPDEFDRQTGQPTAARIRPRPSKWDMFKASGKY